MEFSNLSQSDGNMLNLLKYNSRFTRVSLSKNEQQFAKTAALNLFSTDEKEEAVEGGTAEAEVQSGENNVEEAAGENPSPAVVEHEEESGHYEERKRRIFITREIDYSVLISKKRASIIAEDLRKYEKDYSLFEEFKIFTSGTVAGELTTDFQADIILTVRRSISYYTKQFLLHEIFSPKFDEGADENLESLKKEILGPEVDENDISLVSRAECINKMIELTKFAFSHRIYNIFYEDEFRMLLGYSEFAKFLKVFFVPEFFEANPHLISAHELITAINRCSENINYLDVLEFARLWNLKPNERPASKENLIELNKFIENFQHLNNFNYMVLVYHLYHCSKQSFLADINFDLFASKLCNIYWGTDKDHPSKLNFKNQLTDLLLYKYNLSENNELLSLFLDVFLNSNTFEGGMKQLAVVFTILARVHNGSANISDLLHYYKTEFGDDNFNIYLKRALPSILSKRQKNIAKTYSAGLRAFELTEPPFVRTPSAKIMLNHFLIKENPTRNNLFDENFLKKNSVVYFNHSKITQFDTECYLKSKNNLIETFSFQSIAPQESRAKIIAAGSEKVNDKLQKALIDGDLRVLYQLVHDEAFISQPLKDDYEKDLHKMLTFSSHPQDNLKSRAIAIAEAAQKLKIFHRNRVMYWDNQNKRDNESDPSRRPRFTNRDRTNAPNPRRAGGKTFATKKEISETNEADEVADNLNARETSDKTHPFSNFKKLLQKQEEMDKKRTETEGEDSLNKELSQLANEASKGKIKSKDKDKSSTFLSKKEIKELKSALFEEEDQGKSEIFKEPSYQFEAIEVSKPKRAETQDAEPREVFVTPEFWDGLLGSHTDKDEAVLILEYNFLNNFDQTKAQMFISDFFKNHSLEKYNIPEPEKTFFLMFHQPLIGKKSPNDPLLVKLGLKINYDKLELTDNLELVISLETAFGVLEKDYNKYLGMSVFPYSVGNTGYYHLFKIVSEDFRRKCFKRTIAHFAKYSKSLPDNIWDLIVEICREKKIPMTLYEICSLFIQKNLLSSQEQLLKAIDVMKKFREFSENVEYLAKLYVIHFNADIDISLYRPHLELLMKYRETDRFMLFFEKVKELIASKKPKQEESLSAEENLKKQEETKIKSKANLIKFYKDFTSMLLEFEIYDFGKRLFKEYQSMGVQNDIQDYQNGFAALRDEESGLKNLLKQMRSNPRVTNVSEPIKVLIRTYCDSPVTLSETAHDFFEHELLKNKVELDGQLVNQLVVALNEALEYQLYTKFLNYLLTSKVAFRKNARSICYRYLQRTTDKTIEPQIRNLLAALFDNPLRAAERQKKDQKTNSQKKDLQKDEKLQAQDSKIADPKTQAKRQAEDDLTKFSQSLNQSYKKTARAPKISDQRRSISTPEEDRTLMEELLSDL